MTRRQMHCIAIALSLPAWLLLAVDYARGAIVVPCPVIILTLEGVSTGTVEPGPIDFRVSDIAACEPGTVTGWRWDGWNKHYVVRIEPESEILKEGFE